MVRSWVESRRRGREDPLASLTAAPAASSQVTLMNPPANSQGFAPALTPPVAPAQALVSVIRGIGTPLQSAVSEVAAGLQERGQPVSATDEARAYAQLVQHVVVISRTASTMLGIGRDAVARWNGEPLRWCVLEAVSDIVGAHFRAVGLLQTNGIVSQIVASVVQTAIDGARREDLMPGLGNATQARLGLDMLRAVSPVVHAVTRYAFGRSVPVLVTEVALELQYKAVECTRRLLASGSGLDEWHAVYGAFIGAAGQLYAEAHFAEAERLSRLPAAERAALGPGELPMTAVWEAFDHKVNLLTSFAGYMAAPAGNGSGSAAAALPSRSAGAPF